MKRYEDVEIAALVILDPDFPEETCVCHVHVKRCDEVEKLLKEFGYDTSDFGHLSVAFVGLGDGLWIYQGPLVGEPGFSDGFHYWKPDGGQFVRAHAVPCPDEVFSGDSGAEQSTTPHK